MQVPSEYGIVSYLSKECRRGREEGKRKIKMKCPLRSLRSRFGTRRVGLNDMDDLPPLAPPSHSTDSFLQASFGRCMQR